MIIGDALARVWLRLFGAVSYETGDASLLARALTERREEIAKMGARLHLPTLDEAFGCLDCRVLQSPPMDARCWHCSSCEVIDLTLALRKAGKKFVPEVSSARKPK